MSCKKDRRRDLANNYFSMVEINAIRVGLAVGAFLNSVFIIMPAKTAAQRPAELIKAYFLPIANYPQFILDQYQEVGQKPARKFMTKKNMPRIIHHY